VTGALFALALSVPSQAQQDPVLLGRAIDTSAAPVPFGVGEKVVYGVSWGIFGRRGVATSEIIGVDTIRGKPTYHLSFNLKGKVLAWGIDDTQESWLDTRSLFSHRFKQNLNQPSYKRLRTLDFYPAELKWRQVENPDSGALTTDIPLDDVSFLYWIRTLDLKVGKRYEFNRYYKESGNPVAVEVLRKEKVNVPAGTFNTIVVRPIIRTTGMFKDGDAEGYFSDDERRSVVMMKTQLPMAKATMRLEQYTPGVPISAGWRHP
jgi:hypothetical protein